MIIFPVQPCMRFIQFRHNLDHRSVINGVKCLEKSSFRMKDFSLKAWHWWMYSMNDLQD